MSALGLTPEVLVLVVSLVGAFAGGYWLGRKDGSTP
jgi:uncharacterized protein YneF (UPF0154 family)